MKRLTKIAVLSLLIGIFGGCASQTPTIPLPNRYKEIQEEPYSRKKNNCMHKATRYSKEQNNAKIPSRVVIGYPQEREGKIERHAWVVYEDPKTKKLSYAEPTWKGEYVRGKPEGLPIENYGISSTAQIIFKPNTTIEQMNSLDPKYIEKIFWKKLDKVLLQMLLRKNLPKKLNTKYSLEELSYF